ncbi:MAG: IclR family transcriptional regulator [Chloroflexi bacterium]|nr:IclR family transcriptional regulator [Chloroflexota bacterium]
MNTVKRAAAVLSYLGGAGAPAGVTEISKVLHLSKGTVSRLLSDLDREEFVLQHPETGKYTLGIKVLELGLLAQSRLDLRSASLPYMQQLRNATGETVTLTLRVGMDRMYIAQSPGTYEVRQVPELGRRFPLWAGGSGKVILANLEESEMEGIIDAIRKSGIGTLASGQILDVERLKAELVEVRRQGFAVTVGERLPSFAGVAAPIFERDHKVIGSIAVGGPLPRFGPEAGTRVGPAVGEAARKISLHLGDLIPELARR